MRTTQRIEGKRPTAAVEESGSDGIDRKIKYVSQRGHHTLVSQTIIKRARIAIYTRIIPTIGRAVTLFRVQREKIAHFLKPAERQTKQSSHADTARLRHKSSHTKAANTP